MLASSHWIAVFVSLFAGPAFGVRVGLVIQDKFGLTANNSDTSSSQTRSKTRFPNGFIPSEAQSSLAILISIGLCKQHNVVASAIAKACSLAHVELWIATSANMTCAFDEAQEIGQSFLPTYIEAPEAEGALFVRDFAPTMTFDAKTRQPLKTLGMPYFKGFDSFTNAILKYLHARFAQTTHIQATTFESEWGALVTDGEGLCFLGGHDAAKMGHWLRSIKVCREVVAIAGIDVATGHADIAMSVVGPGKFLISTASPGTPEPPGVQANMDTLLPILERTNGGEGWELPFTSVLAGGRTGGHIAPSTYANALVVTGSGGTYVVFPTYDRIYLKAGDLKDPDNEHVKARSVAKESWVAALRGSLGIQDVGIIEVDAGDLYGLQGSIHCATKNFPAPGLI